MNVNEQIDLISVKIHRRTGYSIRTMVLVARDNAEYNKDRFNSPDPEVRQGAADFFTYSDDSWAIFLDLINEACK